MKRHAVWPGTGPVPPSGGSLCTRDQTSVTAATSVMARLSQYRIFVFESPLFYLIMSPKDKSSEAGDSDAPKAL